MPCVPRLLLPTQLATILRCRTICMVESGAGVERTNPAIRIPISPANIHTASTAVGFEAGDVQ